jgi:8-oxo-dGTP pyrophosphatase MutT (NUDIX family)
MSAQLLQSLLHHLPRFAEEEGDFYSVPRQSLIDVLVQEQTDHSTAKASVSLLETLLDTLAVLDKSRLQSGEWCFVSFPAQLLATSVLTAMSDADSRLFPVNFWNTQGIGNDKKEQQRDALKTIEQARFEHHACHQAQPIRYCYVAWSIIKLDGKILFYQREDTQKRFDKTAGDYGLIGGRANQNDVAGIADIATLLSALQSPNAQIIKDALPQTLKRELREEAGLLFGEHYHFEPWRSLKPYRQVQGAAPNHALTEYYLDIFRIELMLEGFLFLQQRINRDSRLAWIALDDLVRGETADHKIPYIKALYDDFAGDRVALVAALAKLPDSFVAGYLSDKDKFGITLPIAHGKPVLAGVLGKEKAIDLLLNPRQLSLLLGLAAHLRGFEFETVAENIVLHPLGWVEMSDLSTLRREVIELQVLLSGSDLVMESRRERLFRLSIRPDMVFFVDELFWFRVASADLQSRKSTIPVCIGRQAFSTAFGSVSEKSASFELTRSFARRLQLLAAGEFSNQDKEALSTEDNYKKGLHKEPGFKAFGLRNLIRQDGASIRFVLPFACS